MKNLLAGTMAMAGILWLSACSKNEDTSGKSHLQVALTDGPGDFKAVYIDVQDVNINYTDSDDDGWQSLAGFRKGRYNLLTLVNDKDTVLADAYINTGTIKEIRLVLGDDNYVVTNDGDSILLQTPSGQSSGVKLKLNSTVSADVLYKLVLDFDVAKSIHEAGAAGKYMLKPVIRGFMQAQGGTIKGVVAPDSITTAILAINGADTVASTYTDHGNYLIKGIDAGTYALHFIPSDTTLSTMIKEGVTVSLGQVTAVDTVRLK
ncbi:MAG TPA: DUF4382 domain-containing protein [Chitinophaga sp.]|uniref:DUF4382 domain-containing protein n=1 Tax=Chitinophaga sp. TaxID=1869181 RepID=UPI002DBAF7C9|nr:DUF4382 domain-containing protein [Chitinophaga sp.]HEU4553549.1 DUF4382 domain-containing protein [Chitinophaga sp.]